MLKRLLSVGCDVSNSGQLPSEELTAELGTYRKWNSFLWYRRWPPARKRTAK